jgi:DNA-directed RNA polymerase beta' subunit
MMQVMNRRVFLRIGGWALAALALAVPVASGRRAAAGDARARVGVRSRRGERVSRGDEQFCARARFEDAADAMRAAAARGFSGEIVAAGGRV